MHIHLNLFHQNKKIQKKFFMHVNCFAMINQIDMGNPLWKSLHY